MDNYIEASNDLKTYLNYLTSITPVVDKICILEEDTEIDVTFSYTKDDDVVTGNVSIPWFISMQKEGEDINDSYFPHTIIKWVALLLIAKYINDNNVLQTNVVDIKWLDIVDKLINWDFPAEEYITDTKILDFKIV